MKKNVVASILEMSDVMVDKVVKIHNTQYDRRRHLTDREISAARKLREDGHSYSYIASLFDVDARTIRALFDEDFHTRRKAQAKSGSAVALTSDEVRESISERASYKRDLIVSGKLALN